jgi:hypothetical protein
MVLVIIGIYKPVEALSLSETVLSDTDTNVDLSQWSGPEKRQIISKYEQYDPKSLTVMKTTMNIFHLDLGYYFILKQETENPK